MAKKVLFIFVIIGITANIFSEEAFDYSKKIAPAVYENLQKGMDYFFEKDYESAAKQMAKIQEYDKSKTVNLGDDKKPYQIYSYSDNYKMDFFYAMESYVYDNWCRSLFYQGLCYYYLGDYAKSLDLLLSAKEVMIEEEDVYSLLSVVYRKLNRLDETIKLLEEYRAYGINTSFLWDLSWYYIVKDNFQEAAKNGALAFEIDNSLPGPVFNAALAYLLIDDYSKAFTWYVNAFANTKSNDPYILKASGFITDYFKAPQQFEGVESLFQWFIAKKINDPQKAEEYLPGFEKKSQVTALLSDFSLIKDLEPIGLHYLACLYAELNRPKEAVEILARLKSEKGAVYLSQNDLINDPHLSSVKADVEKLHAIALPVSINKDDKLKQLPLQCVVYIEKDKTIAAAVGRGDQKYPYKTLRIYSLKGELIKSFDHTEGIEKVAVSQDGKTILSQADYRVVLWDFTGKKISEKSFPAKGPYLVDIDLSPDGKRAALAFNNDSFLVWEPVSGKETLVVKGFDYKRDYSSSGASVGSSTADNLVRFSANSVYLFTELDNVITTWDSTYKKTGELVCFDHGITDFAADKSGTLFVTGGRNQRLRLWTTDGKMVKSFHGKSTYINAAAISTDGKTAAAADRDNTIFVWNRDTGFKMILKGHTDYIRTIAFIDNDRYLLSSSDDGNIGVWNLANGEKTFITVK